MSSENLVAQFFQRIKHAFGYRPDDSGSIPPYLRIRHDDPKQVAVCKEFQAQIEHHFRFLIDEHGFQVIQFGAVSGGVPSCSVGLANDEWRIWLPWHHRERSTYIGHGQAEFAGSVGEDGLRHWDTVAFFVHKMVNDEPVEATEGWFKMNQDEKVAAVAEQVRTYLPEIVRYCQTQLPRPVQPGEVY